MHLRDSVTPEELRTRTAAFATRIVTLCLPLLDRADTTDVARQLLRSGTAANANYRSAQRGRSHDEFTARLGQASDDIAEAKEWIDLLRAAGVLSENKALQALQDEAGELTKILASAYRTARASQLKRRREKRTDRGVGPMTRATRSSGDR